MEKWMKTMKKLANMGKRLTLSIQNHPLVLMMRKVGHQIVQSEMFVGPFQFPPSRTKITMNRTPLCIDFLQSDCLFPRIYSRLLLYRTPLHRNGLLRVKLLPFSPQKARKKPCPKWLQRYYPQQHQPQPQPQQPQQQWQWQLRTFLSVLRLPAS